MAAATMDVVFAAGPLSAAGFRLQDFAARGFAVKDFASGGVAVVDFVAVDFAVVGFAVKVSAAVVFAQVDFDASGILQVRVAFAAPAGVVGLLTSQNAAQELAHERKMHRAVSS